MVLQRKRSLFVGLGLSVALVLAVALPATASAQSTLTGEFLDGISPSGNSPACPATYSVPGTATGPYPGTFTEAGTFDASFSATFTITSGTTTITGSKLGNSATVSCSSSVAVANLTGSYTATIHAPNGNFHDEGVTTVTVFISLSSALLVETFTSSLTEPVLIAPTSKDQCKKNGWKNFPQFKNQGQCEKSVKA
jgi:hypothetical protein